MTVSFDYTYYTTFTTKSAISLYLSPCCDRNYQIREAEKHSETGKSGVFVQNAKKGFFITLKL